jgi:hypothetical protein
MNSHSLVASCPVALVLPLFGFGCGGQDPTLGLEEPLRVQSAQFVEGALPGLPPAARGTEPVTPTVTGYGGLPLLRAGERARGVGGTVSADAASIALRFLDLGSGYWVRPVAAPDLEGGSGGFVWQVSVDVAPDAPPGLHPLRLAAIGPDGRAGSQVETEVCIAPLIPDKRRSASVLARGNACNPEEPPPALVVSLGWDAPVDLDLVVVTPEGKRISAKRPTTGTPDASGNVDVLAPGIGVLDQDANEGCTRDGVSRESLVFDEAPLSGRYAVYVSLFDPCGEPSVRFSLSLHAIVGGAEPGTFRQVETFRQGGAALADQADAGLGAGLFVTEFVVQ